MVDVRTPALRRRLSDAELLNANFRVSNPEELQGLNTGVPDIDAHPVIIGYYDETPTGGRASNPNFPFVRCCHCGKRRHWKGHVVRDDRGELYIIGASKCGREHYGARYESAEKAFRNEQARRKALIRWQKMSLLVPSMSAEVQSLLSSATLAAIELKRDEIRRASPEAFQPLQHIAEPGVPIIEIREERDFAAESVREARYDKAMQSYNSKPHEERRRLRDEGLKPERETAPIYKRDYLQLGHLQGGAFLTSEGDVRGAALSLRDTLNAVLKIGDTGTESKTTTELQRLLAQMTGRPDVLRRALHAISFTKLFFSSDNLDRLQAWSARESRYTFAREGRSLVITNSYQYETTVAPLASVDLPKCETIDYWNYRDDQFQWEKLETLAAA